MMVKLTANYFLFTGSRTIRTEEAILISLAALEEKFSPNQRPKEFDLSSAIPQSEDTGVPQYAFSEPRKRKRHSGYEESNGQESENGAADDANGLGRFD